MFNKKKTEQRLEEFNKSDLKKQNNELKKVIRLIFKVMFWCSVFLLMPTITSYFIKWKGIIISRDIGIGLLSLILWKINKKMDKKRKEEMN